MKILILNHHFSQDIEELRVASSTEHHIKTISPEYFANHAKRIFPANVFNEDLSIYHRQELKNSRSKYTRKAHSLLYDLYKVFQFDVFILPSDTFFYIRAVITACQNLNIPVIVVQKELGVTSYQHEVHSKIIALNFPVICDWMTTCTEYSKQFWVLAGSPPERISVVGQPRFDFYFRDINNSRNNLKQLKNGKNVINFLFLAYDLDAYSNFRAEGQNSIPWKELLEQTLNELIEIASNPRINVLVKPHPQQNKYTLQYIKEKVKHTPNIKMANGEIDTRILLLDCDVIIAFQTTTLMEALILDKKVIYTFWTDAVLNVSEQLLPFHKMSNFLSIATSKDSFQNYLSNVSEIIGGKNLSQQQHDERISSFYELLGPIDGKSSKRVWDIVKNVFIMKNLELDDKHILLRNKIANNNEAFFSSEINKSRINLLKLHLFFWLKFLPNVGNKADKHLLHFKYHERMRILECKNTNSSEFILFGSTSLSLFQLIKEYIFNKIFKSSI